MLGFQCSYLTPQGIQLDNAYVIISGINNASVESTSFNVLIYRDKEAFDSSLDPAINTYYEMPTSTDMAAYVLSKCHDYLKSLPKFVNPVDVPDSPTTRTTTP